MKAKSLFLIVLALVLSACYWQADVHQDEVGVRKDRNAIIDCVGPGVYTDWNFFADMDQVSRSTVTFSVDDPEVATSDNQSVGVRVTIQARRMSNCDSIKNLLSNWPALIADQALVDTVSATAREGMKIGTRAMTLNQLLDDRNGLAGAIRAALEQDAGNYSVEIINVTVENIAPSAEWLAIMQEKANIVAETDREKQRQNLIQQKASNDRYEQEQRESVLKQQLAAEKAQTSVDVEIAKRAGEVTAASQEVYSNNPQAYELKRLEWLAKIFGEKAVFYFLPQGTDLNLLFGQQPGQVVPLISPQPTPPPATP